MRNFLIWIPHSSFFILYFQYASVLSKPFFIFIY